MVRIFKFKIWRRVAVALAVVFLVFFVWEVGAAILNVYLFTPMGLTVTLTPTRFATWFAEIAGPIGYIIELIVYTSLKSLYVSIFLLFVSIGTILGGTAGGSSIPDNIVDTGMIFQDASDKLVRPGRYQP